MSITRFPTPATQAAPATTQPEGRLLSESEAATYLCVSRSALRKWRLQGSRVGSERKTPPYVRIGLRGVRYDLLALDAWIEQNLIQR